MQRSKLDPLIMASYESMYRLAFTYVKNRDDAMDIVQEAVCRAIANAHTLKKETAAKSWLMSITANCARNLLQKKAKDYPEENLPEAEAADHYPDPDLAAALNRLTDTDRTILVLRYFEDIRIKDIADALKLNERTVKSTLYRSLKKLKIDSQEGDFTDE